MNDYLCEAISLQDHLCIVTNGFFKMTKRFSVNLFMYRWFLHTFFAVDASRSKHHHESSIECNKYFLIINFIAVTVRQHHRYGRHRLPLFYIYGQHRLTGTKTRRYIVTVQRVGY
jgi:hypothetical protein